MNKNHFLFLSLFGSIDDELVIRSEKPWQGSQNTLALRKYLTGAACAAVIILLSMACIFHSEVKAALHKFTTAIGEMLRISEDISSYTEIKNSSITKNGLTLTLEEVILDKNQLFLLVSQKFEDGRQIIDTELSDHVKINGRKLHVKIQHKTDASPEAPAGKYVLNYYLDKDFCLEDPVEIEAVFTVNKIHNMDEIGKYRFIFHASMEKSNQRTAVVQSGQVITLSDGTPITIKDFLFNSVESTITAVCENLPPGREYYLKGKDNLGNQVTYRLLSYENPKMVFVIDNNGYLSPNASNVELQLYEHSSLGTLIDSEEDDSFMEESFLDENVYQMTKIGNAVTIHLTDPGR